ncbi:MAG: HINT domain-containing protein [Nitrospiraceae bacterium]|nr:HINT domain-containing protein [Nitrospiraceae bacterium]
MGDAYQTTVTAVLNFPGAAATFISNTAQQAWNDPIGFIKDVGQGIVDTNTVIANTVTFGMIPGVNERANELVKTNKFYQFVNIASVIGREFLIGAATGGIGNLATRGFSAARGLAMRFVASQAPRVGQTIQAVRAAAAPAASALACRLTSLNRMLQPAQAVSNVSTMASNIQEAQAAIARGDFETAGRLLARTGGMIGGTLSSLRESARFAGAVRTLNPESIRGYLAACFAAGTPIWGEFGPRAIETYREKDKVWARDENDPNGPLVLREIEEVFVTIGMIWHLHVGGEIVRTTDEHPWFVEGKGWTATMLLQAGDRIIGRDGTSVAAEEAHDTGEVETVYNFRVAEHHTYFVGDATWGCDLWAHNLCVKTRSNATGTWNPRQRGASRATIYGTSQDTGGVPTGPLGSNQHQASVQRVMQRVANNQTFTDPSTGMSHVFSLNSNSYIVLNRNLRTGLGGQRGGIVPVTFGASANIRPDHLIVEQTGPTSYRVSMIEVASPGQRPVDLVAKMRSAWSGLGFSATTGITVTQGSFIVTNTSGITQVVAR